LKAEHEWSGNREALSPALRASVVRDDAPRAAVGAGVGSAVDADELGEGTVKVKDEFPPPRYVPTSCAVCKECYLDTWLPGVQCIFRGPFTGYRVRNEKEGKR
jgi:hypothetical protein